MAALGVVTAAYGRSTKALEPGRDEGAPKGAPTVLSRELEPA